jgi:hypothetical protein
MARYDAFDSAMGGAQVIKRSGGGWRQLFWFSVAAAGLGFAGYVYLVPYHQMVGALETRSRELREQRGGGQEIVAERDRLKTDMGRFEQAEKNKAAKEAKRKEDLHGLAAQLKPALEEMGALVTSSGERVVVSLSADKAVDKNGIDVSEAGNAVLKVLAAELKKSGGGARIRAKFGASPAPKQLRSLFGTVGEVSAVRAARVMSALQGAGVAPEQLSVVGEAETVKSSARPPGAKSKKAAVAASATADRLDIEVEPS